MKAAETEKTIILPRSRRPPRHLRRRITRMDMAMVAGKKQVAWGKGCHDTG